MGKSADIDEVFRAPSRMIIAIEERPPGPHDEVSVLVTVRDGSFVDGRMTYGEKRSFPVTSAAEWESIRAELKAH